MNYKNFWLGFFFTRLSPFRSISNHSIATNPCPHWPPLVHVPHLPTTPLCLLRRRLTLTTLPTISITLRVPRNNSTLSSSTRASLSLDRLRHDHGRYRLGIIPIFRRRRRSRGFFQRDSLGDGGYIIIAAAVLGRGFGGGYSNGRDGICLVSIRQRRALSSPGGRKKKEEAGGGMGRRKIERK